MTTINRQSLQLVIACAVAFAPAAAIADGPEAKPAIAPTETGAMPPPPAPVPYASAYWVPVAYPAPPLPPLTYSAAELPPADEGPYLPREGPRPRYGMRKAGIVATFVGVGVATIGGVVLGAVASSEPSRSEVFGDGPRQLGIGLGGAMLGLGGLSVLVGIPLWAIGSASIPASPAP